MKKYLLTALSALSLIPGIPYLLQAWSSSRLDAWDWLFYLAAIPALIWAFRKNPMQKPDLRALVITILALLLAFGGRFHQVNSLTVAGGTLCVWSVTCLLGGWTFASRLLPGFILMLLGTPSSTYRIAQMLTVSTGIALCIKILLASGCFGWIFANKRLDWKIKGSELLFISALLASAIVLFHARELYFSGNSFVPAFQTQVGNFYGRNIEPDSNTRRFFATSEVKLFRYIVNGREVSVLAVRCGNDIHEIHPASHCLRTSRWVVSSEDIYPVYPDFAVTEIDAAKGNRRALFWVWYSSDEFSTPGFLGFRRRFRNNGKYHTFQISIPVVENDVDSARNILKNFIAELARENIK